MAPPSFNPTGWRRTAYLALSLLLWVVGGGLFVLWLGVMLMGVVGVFFDLAGAY
jgi:hypothetical protein